MTCPECEATTTKLLVRAGARSTHECLRCRHLWDEYRGGVRLIRGEMG